MKRKPLLFTIFNWKYLKLIKKKRKSDFCQAYMFRFAIGIYRLVGILFWISYWSRFVVNSFRDIDLDWIRIALEMLSKNNKIKYLQYKQVLGDVDLAHNIMFRFINRDMYCAGSLKYIWVTPKSDLKKKNKKLFSALWLLLANLKKKENLYEITQTLRTEMQNEKFLMWQLNRFDLRGKTIINNLFELSDYCNVFVRSRVFI